MPAAWIEGLNRMDLNIVPAKFVKTTIEACKYDKHDENTKQKIGELKNEKPVEVLFEGADTDIYGVTKEFSKDLVDEFKLIKEDFCFLHVGHWLQGNMGEDRKILVCWSRHFLKHLKIKKINLPSS